MNTLHTLGTLDFTVEHKTKKHNAQGVWKTTAIIKLDDDIEKYYRWFLMRRYSLELLPSIRGTHITFINDRTSEIDNEVFEQMKVAMQGKEIAVVLNLDPRSDGIHWWLNIPEEDRSEIHTIRNLIGLGRPKWGLHMSVGHAADKKIPHSQYIHRLLTKNLIP
jgi:hypothetical protein